MKGQVYKRGVCFNAGFFVFDETKKKGGGGLTRLA